MATTTVKQKGSFSKLDKAEGVKLYIATRTIIASSGNQASPTYTSINTGMSFVQTVMATATRATTGAGQIVAIPQDQTVSYTRGYIKIHMLGAAKSSADVSIIAFGLGEI